MVGNDVFFSVSWRRLQASEATQKATGRNAARLSSTAPSRRDLRASEPALPALPMASRDEVGNERLRRPHPYPMDFWSTSTRPASRTPRRRQLQGHCPPHIGRDAPRTSGRGRRGGSGLRLVWSIRAGSCGLLPFDFAVWPGGQGSSGKLSQRLILEILRGLQAERRTVFSGGDGLKFLEAVHDIAGLAWSAIGAEARLALASPVLEGDLVPVCGAGREAVGNGNFHFSVFRSDVPGFPRRESAGSSLPTRRESHKRLNVATKTIRFLQFSSENGVVSPLDYAPPTTNTSSPHILRFPKIA